MLQDVASYEEMQETLALLKLLKLLKLLALGQHDLDAGHLVPVDEAFDRVLARKRRAAKPALKPTCRSATRCGSLPPPSVTSTRPTTTSPKRHRPHLPTRYSSGCASKSMA